MAQINSKAINPERYAQIKREQSALEKQYATHITIARLCTFCGNKLEVLCQGSHGATYIKCPQCGERVFFPPVSFRRAS